MYHTFIGIDIGKSSFYSVVYGNKKARVYNNNLEGFQQFCKDHEQVLNDSLVVLETTGGYEIALINHLKNYPCVVHRANTRKVKHFLRSLGKIGKSDAIDAAGLA